MKYRYLSLFLLFQFSVVMAEASRPFRYVMSLPNGRQVVAEKTGCCCPSSMGLYGTMTDMVTTRDFATNASNGLGIYGQSSKGTLPSVGDVTIPVIMASFPDRDFLETTTVEKVNRLFNEVGYHDQETPAIVAAGSVRDYFVQNSGGMFRPSFKVISPVKLSRSYTYYGKNSSSRNDINISEMINEAIKLATDAGTDFSQFARGANGVPLVVVYFAGPGEHASYEEGSSNYIWPHFNGNVKRNIGGVTFASYFVGNETMQDYDRDAYVQNQKYVVTASYTSGIGVLIHELGHALGLPDLYDTKYSTDVVRETPNYWSVMDYGQYQENGYRPMQYSAYERSCLGWLDIQPLSAEGTVTVNPGEAYLVQNPDNELQYYIIETRDEDTWFRRSRFGKGLLVWHIDYNRSRWGNNEPNNYLDAQGVHVVPADGAWQAHNTLKDWNEFRGDLYPGDYKDEASLTHTSLQLYNMPLFNIRMEGSSVLLDCGTNGLQNQFNARPSTLGSQSMELNPWISIQNGQKYLHR
ncbi:MAG: M6 family metalloprotease domain-containing protein [Bacteroidaceae bacterium]|nr:M6 family metalloprotease domain-containing protein [Bacteroidaceae bacterium]